MNFSRLPLDRQDGCSQPCSHDADGNFIHNDNGNVMGLVAASDGMVSARYAYGPFGEPLRATGPQAANPFRFSTKYRDAESGLYYDGFRYYAPITGRWIGNDSVGQRTVVWQPSDYGRPKRPHQRLIRWLADPALFSRAFKGKVLGRWTCDPTGAPSGPGTIENMNSKCSKVCTQEHEEQHEKDMGDCCRKFRKAWQQSTPEWQAVLQMAWQDFINEARPWAECNASQKTLECINRERKKRKCWCFKDTFTSCCGNLLWLRGAEKMNVKEYCRAPGSKSKPQCPF